MFAPGMAVADGIGPAMAAAGEALHRGNMMVVAHKIVSKNDGHMVDIAAIAPGASLAMPGSKPATG